MAIFRHFSKLSLLNVNGMNFDRLVLETLRKHFVQT